MQAQHTNMIHNPDPKMEQVPYYSIALPLLIPWSWHGWLVEDVLLCNDLESNEKQDPQAGFLFCEDDGYE